MQIQLLLATTMSLATVAIHLTGLAFLVRLLRSHHRLVRPLKRAPVAILLTATIMIFLIHAAEIWLYALLYVLLGAIDSFEVALYFSTSTYSSVGYGDVVLGEDWRILGAIEGATGLIMIGWSTAFLVSFAGAAQTADSRLADARYTRLTTGSSISLPLRLLPRRT